MSFSPKQLVIAGVGHSDIHRLSAYLDGLAARLIAAAGD
jgi:hypothetical protein